MTPIKDNLNQRSKNELKKLRAKPTKQTPEERIERYLGFLNILYEFGKHGKIENTGMNDLAKSEKGINPYVVTVLRKNGIISYPNGFRHGWTWSSPAKPNVEMAEKAVKQTLKLASEMMKGVHKKSKKEPIAPAKSEEVRQEIERKVESNREFDAFKTGIQVADLLKDLKKIPSKEELIILREAFSILNKLFYGS
jgi:hypothetical protein